MTNARDIALKALAHEEEPARTRREREEQRRKRELQVEQKRQAASDERRLRACPIVAWFPDQQWEVKDHYNGGTVYHATGTQNPEINLWVIEDGEDFIVKWTPHEDWIKTRWGDHVRPSRRGWDGPEVKSAADVGREIRKWDDIGRSMPDHLP
jgi:hypothetical protein